MDCRPAAAWVTEEELRASRGATGSAGVDTLSSASGRVTQCGQQPNSESVGRGQYQVRFGSQRRDGRFGPAHVGRPGQGRDGPGETGRFGGGGPAAGALGT